MLAAVYDECGQGYLRKTEIWEIDAENLLKAHETFEIYKKRKVISNNCFDDDKWCLSNQKMNFYMDFFFSEYEFQNNAMRWLECTSDCYRNCIKAYIVFTLGNLELESLRSICNVFKRITKYNPEKVFEVNK